MSGGVVAPAGGRLLTKSEGPRTGRTRKWVRRSGTLESPRQDASPVAGRGGRIQGYSPTAVTGNGPSGPATSPGPRCVSSGLRGGRRLRDAATEASDAAGGRELEVHVGALALRLLQRGDGARI